MWCFVEKLLRRLSATGSVAKFGLIYVADKAERGATLGVNVIELGIVKAKLKMQDFWYELDLNGPHGFDEDKYMTDLVILTRRRDRAIGRIESVLGRPLKLTR